MKLLTLLISTLLIATASATIYKYMYIDGSVDISTSTGLKWVKGSDAPSSTTIAGSTVTLPLLVNNGTPVNFTYCLYLVNLDSAKNHSLTIEVTTASGTTDFIKFNLMLFENVSSTHIHTLDVTTTGSYVDTIVQSDVWRFTFEVYATPSASGLVYFDIDVTYED